MEEEVLGKAYDARLMRRLLSYMRPYKAVVAFSLVFLLLNSLLQVAGPLLTKIAVDKYLAPSSIAGPNPLDPYLSRDPWTGITQISLLYLTVLALALAAEFLQIYSMQWTGQHAMFDLRRQLMGCLQKLDIAFFDHNPVAGWSPA